MVVVQVLNRAVAGWKPVGRVKLRIILHELRRINVRPLADQLLERL